MHAMFPGILMVWISVLAHHASLGVQGSVENIWGTVVHQGSQGNTEEQMVSVYLHVCIIGLSLIFTIPFKADFTRIARACS